MYVHISTQYFFNEYKRNQPQWNIEKTDVSIFTLDVKCDFVYIMGMAPAIKQSLASKSKKLLILRHIRCSIIVALSQTKINLVDACFISVYFKKICCYKYTCCQ